MRNLAKKITTRFPSDVWTITLVGGLNSMAISLSLPFLALYLYENRGVSMAMVGLFMLVTGLCAVAAQLTAGVITDKLGRRPLLMITMSSSVLLYAAMAVLIGLDAPVALIVTVYVLVRSFLTMQRPAIQSIVVDLVPKEKLTETYGLMIIGGNLGFAAGPAIGGLLADFLTYAWLFGLGAVIIGVAFLVITFHLKESFSGSTERVAVSSILAVGKDRNLLIFTGICFVLFMVASQLASTTSVFTVSHVGFSTAQYGTLLTLNGLMITALQYPSTRLMSRLPISYTLVIGAVLYAVGYLSMAWVGAYGLALGAIAMVTAGEICCTPTILTVVGKLASRNWRGRYMAFFGIAETLGFSVGPLLGGLLLDRYITQPLYVWGTLGLLAICAAFGFGIFGSKMMDRDSEIGKVESKSPG